MSTPTKIDPKRLYSATELLHLGVFKTKDHRTMMRIILEDKLAAKPVLKAQITGTGSARRYFILGQDAVRFSNKKS